MLVRREKIEKVKSLITIDMKKSRQDRRLNYILYNIGHIIFYLLLDQGRKVRDPVKVLFQVHRRRKPPHPCR